jgi:hypothetical protein
MMPGDNNTVAVLVHHIENIFYCDNNYDIIMYNIVLALIHVTWLKIFNQSSIKQIPTLYGT